ncbi:MAG: hypothetical protein LBS57_05915 [Treponema sp.]|jgi:hypothetical protein|nr:hypothetical protein [Treponema sp.]
MMCNFSGEDAPAGELFPALSGGSLVIDNYSGHTPPKTLHPREARVYRFYEKG